MVEVLSQYRNNFYGRQLESHALSPPSSVMHSWPLFYHGVSDLRTKGKVSLADEAIAAFPEDPITVYLERDIVVLVIGTGIFEVTEYLQVEVDS